MDDVKKELLRLGRKKSYLQKCIKVNQLLSEHESDTSVRIRIFEKHIKPIILCSSSQFYNILNEPNPQKQLNQLEVQIAELSNTNQHEVEILEFLSKKGDATTHDIACLFSVKKHKIVYQINKLANKALILKKEHPTREDMKIISITEKGKKKLKESTLIN